MAWDPLGERLAVVFKGMCNIMRHKLDYLAPSIGCSARFGKPSHRFHKVLNVCLGLIQVALHAMTTTTTTLL